MSAISKKLTFYDPTYYAPNDSKISHCNKNSLIIRIFYSILPFIALYKPFGQAITFVMDSIRTFCSFSELLEKKDAKKIFNIAIAISALAGTIFMHPLGLCISTLNNLGIDINFLITQLHLGNTEEVLSSLLSIAENFFYLGTMLVGSIEVIALSILLNMAIEIVRSRKELKNGNFLEASSHLLMSFVRFFQAAPFIEKIAYKHDLTGKEISKNLVETMTKIRDKIAIYFYSAARFFINPVWKITEKGLEAISLNKNDKASTKQKVYSTAKTVFSSLLLFPFAIAGLILGHIFHFSAFLLSTTPYIHIKNTSKLQPLNKSFSLFQLNCCLTAGGFSKLFGGIDISNDERVLKIAEMIKRNNPDLVCLQEVSDIKDAYKLYNELSKDYADFYLNMGATPFILQNNSGLFVASKTDIKNPKLHSFSDINGVENMVNKCFFSFSANNANIITTHLSPSHDDLQPNSKEVNTRSIEQLRIFEEATKKSSENNKPTYVLGDFNINWDSDEYKNGKLFSNANDSYNKNRKEVSIEDATSETEYLISQNWNKNKEIKPQKLIIDYFLSLFDKSRSIKTRKISTFDINDSENALSDHSALISTIG